jgi:hypothetical protein
MLHIFTIFGCSLGTEVGNGVRDRRGTSTQVGNNSSGDGPQASETASMPDSQASEKNTMESYSRYLRVACATPFVEAKLGTWKSSGNTIIEFKEKEFDKVLVMEGQEFRVKPVDSTSNSFQASIIPDTANLTCLSVTPVNRSSTLVRQVIFSDNVRLIWRMEAADVVSISLENPAGVVMETWSKR